MSRRVKLLGETSLEDCIVDPNIKSSYVVPLNKITVIGKDVYYDGEKLPPVPTESSHVKVFTSNNNIYANTFEWKNGRWERTLKALWYYLCV